MKRMMFMFSMCATLMACGAESEMEVQAQKQVLHDQSIDLGYITLLTGSMEGVLFGQSVDQVTSLDGRSDLDSTQIMLISNQPDNEMVTMGLHSFVTDVATANPDELQPDHNLGCAGLTSDYWSQDKSADFHTTLIRKEADLYIIDFEMDFDSGEWLKGTYTFIVN